MSPNPHPCDFLIVGLDQMKFQAENKVVWAPTIDLAAIRYRWRGLPFVHVCATALSLTPLDLVVWAKASAGAGNLYRSQHELLPLFTSEINNDPRLPLVAHRVISLGCGIWSLPGHSGLWRAVHPADLLVHGLDRAFAPLE